MKLYSSGAVLCSRLYRWLTWTGLSSETTGVASVGLTSTGSGRNRMKSYFRKSTLSREWLKLSTKNIPWWFTWICMDIVGRGALSRLGTITILILSRQDYFRTYCRSLSRRSSTLRNVSTGHNEKWRELQGLLFGARSRSPPFTLSRRVCVAQLSKAICLISLQPICNS